MATKDFEILDMQDDDQEINMEFHDSTVSEEKYGESSGQTVYFSNFPSSAVDDDQEETLLDTQEEGTASKSSNFLTLEYYQQFFNVDTKQVGERIMWSMVPKPGTNYLQSHIRPNPDLYGPFWIAVTLVLTTAVTGNLASYFQSADTDHWKYDFHKVTLCTSFIFSYAIIVPVCVWALLRWRKSQEQLTLLEITCLYGYSLSVFVPVSILWLFPIPWLQWCLGIVASVLSGCVLFRTVTPSLQREGRKIAMAVGLVIIVLHAALALGFMLYFFYPPSIPVKVDVSVANKTVGADTDSHAPAEVPKSIKERDNIGDAINLNVVGEEIDSGGGNAGTKIGATPTQEKKNVDKIENDRPNSASVAEDEKKDDTNEEVDHKDMKPVKTGESVPETSGNIESNTKREAENDKINISADSTNMKESINQESNKSRDTGESNVSNTGKSGSSSDSSNQLRDIDKISNAEVSNVDTDSAAR